MKIIAPSKRALGVRAGLRRNRKVSYRIGDMVTDGLGNILDRPLTKGLSCFGDPIERLWGRYDEPRQWGDADPEPRGCAMCPVKLFCYHITEERLGSCGPLHDTYLDWLNATSHLSQEDAHTHPTWTTLASAIEARRWSDANDDKLEKAEAEKVSAVLAKASAKAARARRQKKRKPRRVPRRILLKIQDYRDARLEEIVKVSQSPSAPLWIRNRDYERLVLVVDAWQARETLEYENRKGSAAEVQKWLVHHSKIEASSPVGMRQRIGEALRRAEQLVADNTWPFFDPNPLPPPRGISGYTGLNPATIHTLIDDD